MNYGELKAQFEGLLKRRDLTTTQRDTFISQGIARTQRVLRIPPMEKSIAITYDEDEFTNGEIPIPEDFLRLKAFTRGKVELKLRDLPGVLLYSDILGNPEAYARRGGVWKFDRLPAAGTIFRIDYYAEFAALSADADTNYITIAAADCVIYAALSYAADFFIDRRAQAFDATFMRIVAEIQNQSDQDELVNSVVSPSYDFPEDD